MRWLGTQTAPARYLHLDKINPVCITAGALANGSQVRGLYVSGELGMVLGGLLINARALLNGRSIYRVQDMPLDGFSYYHVELDAHCVILAEGCATESYLDMPSRDAFDNGAARVDAPPITGMDLPRITTRRLVPGAIVARLDGDHDRRRRA